MGSKRLRTVIQTDESLSKASWADSEAWTVLKFPDQLSILERSCKHSLCTDLLRDKSISCVIYWHPSLPLQPSLSPAAGAVGVQSTTKSRDHCWYWVCGSAGHGSRGKLLPFGRARVALAVLQPHTTLVPRDVPYTMVAVPAASGHVRPWGGAEGLWGQEGMWQDP